MTGLDQALNVVRKAHPNDLIWDAFEVDGKWYFMYTIGKFFSPDDVSGAGLVVEGDECSRFSDYWTKIMTDKKFNTAYNKRVPIDVRDDKLV